MTAGLDAGRSARWEGLAAQLRRDTLRACEAAGSGHPSSSLSCADLIAVLVADFLRADLTGESVEGNDGLVFSKGHASALLYAVLRSLDVIDDEQLLTFRKFGSRLEGHPRPGLPLIEVPTGSLGQGLPIAVGMALAARRLARNDARMFALCGDGEMGEGSMWEAISHAAGYGLGNLIAIVDVNGLAQDGPVFGAVRADELVRRSTAFGWDAIEIDGHDVAQINAAFELACTRRERPFLIAARTIKGRGVPMAEGALGMHGKPLDSGDLRADAPAARVEIKLAMPTPKRPRRPAAAEAEIAIAPKRERPRFAIGTVVGTRTAFGEAVAWWMSRNPRAVALDAGVVSSTFGGALPGDEDRFIPVDISEQQLLAAAVGLGARGWEPCVSTFAAFLGRAADFVRMASIGGSSFIVCGSHGGVSVGPDGPSQMGLEDLALMRSVDGSTVLSPCDANQTVALIEAVGTLPGIRYLRTIRPAMPVIYEPETRFVPGGSALPRASDADQVLLVGTGITVHACLAAADSLSGKGIAARVLDAYSVKPLDREAILANARACGGRIVTVEDHRPEGGLGELVCSCLLQAGEDCVAETLAVREVPGSGEAEDLARAAGIDAGSIASAAERVCSGDALPVGA